MSWQLCLRLKVGSGGSYRTSCTLQHRVAGDCFRTCPTCTFAISYPANLPPPPLNILFWSAIWIRFFKLVCFFILYVCDCLRARTVLETSITVLGSLFRQLQFNIEIVIKCGTNLLIYKHIKVIFVRGDADSKCSEISFI